MGTFGFCKLFFAGCSLLGCFHHVVVYSVDDAALRLAIYECLFRCIASHMLSNRKSARGAITIVA